MDHLHTTHFSALLGAVAIGLVLVGTTRRVLLGGVMLLAAAEVGLGWSLAGASSIGLSAGALAAGAAGVLVIAAIAAVLVRFPSVVIPLVLGAAPFRLPLDVDPKHRFLVAVAQGGGLGRLLPLYVVLAAAVLAFLFRLARGVEMPIVLPRVIAVPVAAFLAFASLSLLWSQDPEAAASRLAFFILPFAALVAVVGRTPFSPWIPRALAVIAVGFALLFAVIGLVQSATHRLLFFSPGVEVANAYGPIFRVTSLFRDPSLYGRHVVLGIAVLLVLMWLRRLEFALAAALIGIMWAGLYVSYSQSSIAALFSVALAVPALAGTVLARRAVAVAAAVMVVAVAVLVVVEARNNSVQRTTSDRSRRVELAVRVFEARPIAGVGLAAQERASQARDDNPAPVTNYVSHTTPLTIAAELGLIGLALYAAVLVGAIRLIDRVRREAPALGLSLGAVLLALFVHALFYSGFFEDPITWTALAIGASFLVARSARANLAAAGP